MWAPVRPRPTRRSCTPASTPSPEAWSRPWSGGATSCSRPTRRAAGIAFEETGAVLVAWDEEQEAQLDGVLSKARANEYDGPPGSGSTNCDGANRTSDPGPPGPSSSPTSRSSARGARASRSPTEAVGAGVELRLGTAVTDVGRHLDTGRWTRPDAEGPVRADWVVNAAGLLSDRVNRWFGHDEFTIAPRRGQLIVFDKLARPLVSSIVLPVPTETDKGCVGGPHRLRQRAARPHGRGHRRSTGHRDDGTGTRRVARRGAPHFARPGPEEVTATYAGVRAATEHRDYQITIHEHEHYVCVGGIRSTGLTASLAIAEFVVGQMERPVSR